MSAFGSLASRLDAAGWLRVTDGVPIWDEWRSDWLVRLFTREPPNALPDILSVLLASEGPVVLQSTFPPVDDPRLSTWAWTPLAPMAWRVPPNIPAARIESAYGCEAYQVSVHRAPPPQLGLLDRGIPDPPLGGSFCANAHAQGVLAVLVSNQQAGWTLALPCLFIPQTPS